MIFSDSSILLLISILFSVVALAILFASRITPWTPFHLALASMIVVTLFTLWPQIADDSFGRTKYSPIRLDVAASILAGSVFFAVSAFLFRRRRSVSLPRTEDYPDSAFRINLNVLAVICVCVSLFAAIRSYHKLGNLNLLAIGSAQSVAGGLTNAEAMGGPVNALGRAASRILPFVCVVEFLYCFDSVFVFVRRRLFLCTCTAGVLLLAVFDGQRTQIILPLATVLFGLAVAGRVSTKLVAIAAIFGTVFFVVVGEFRSRDFTTGFQLRHSTGIETIDKTLRWFVTYTEPSIYNFNNLANLHPKQSMGLSWFSQVAPSSIFKYLMKYPPTAPEILGDHDDFAQPGLTFRTSYADWYLDFGFIGGVLTVAATWLLTLYAFNKSLVSPRMLWLYLCLSYATANLAFLNLFIGIPFVFPLLILPFTKPSRTASYGYQLQ